jgi:serine/threonine protein kinase
MRTLPFRLGRFTLFDHVASGGMADIYLARVKTELGGSRLLVIKEMLPQRAAEERWSEMLIDEAKLAAQLSHANIARVEELGQHEGSLYIAMEYVEGLDLRELLKQCSQRKIPLPMEYRLFVLREVLRALDYAHRFRLEDAIGIIHRDVTPSNVLLSFDGEVKLCDFGIATAVSLDLAPSDTIEGKAGYMSPEHARGDLVDERADLFAVGILLWELLSGRRMYKATTTVPLIDVARAAEIPELKKLNLPDEPTLRAIVDKALAPDIDDRYASAGVMLDDLLEYCISTKQMASALRFGEWLSMHFAKEKLARRRSRERALTALELGPPLVIEARPSNAGPSPASEPPVSEPPVSEPPVSEPPVSEPPVSEPPASEPPAITRSADGGGKIAFVAFAMTFALLTLLAWLKVIRW